MVRRSARARQPNQTRRVAQPPESADAVQFTLAPGAMIRAAEVPPEGVRGVYGGPGGGFPSQMKDRKGEATI